MALKIALGVFTLATFSVITGNQDVLDWPVILGSDAWLYCVPERSAEKHGKTDWVKEAGWEMYIERKEADGTWTYVAGAERSNSTSEWRVMVAAGSRYKMFGHGFLGIQNISKADNNTLYKCMISGSDSIYMEHFEVKLCVMEAKAVQEISNANLTSLCNCSEHCNCTSPMDHIEPPKETSNANLTKSPCNCSDHNNCTSPVDHIEPPKVHTGPACPEMSNLTCAVCNCSISNSTLPANDTQIAQTCPACPEVSKLNCTVCNCSNDTQTEPRQNEPTLLVIIYVLSALLALALIVILIQNRSFLRRVFR